MKRRMFLTFILLSTSLDLVMAETPKAVQKTQMSEKWHKLDKLLSEEIKTIHSLQDLGPKLRFRLLELYTEKIRLLKEKENKIFLSTPPMEIKKKGGKKAFFKGSQDLYKKTMAHGLKIIKDFPRFKYTPDIYYTLALNSRDFGGDKHTEFYLLKALSFAPKSSPLVHSTKTALAEFYYNEKKYKKAIHYYSDVLKNPNDEWYAKHLYNISWCFFKIRKYDLAIDHLKNAYFKGEEKRYLAVRDQVLESVGLFYVYGNRVEEGVQFYLEHVQRPATHLIKMSQIAAEKISFDSAHYIIKKALENAITKKDYEEQATIHLSELDIYRNHKRLDLYFKTANSLGKLHQIAPLKEEQRIDAITKIKSLVGYLQVRLSKNMKVGITDYDHGELHRIIQYFNILAVLDTVNQDQYTYFQGETYFAVSDFNQAAKSYIKAFNYSFKKENNKDLQRKILDSLLGTIAEGRFDKKTHIRYTIYTYKNYLKLWPVDPKSREIYKKLFNLYVEHKKLPPALDVLDTYRKHYPQDLNEHRPMLTQIIDIHIKEKNSERLAFWISKLEKGHLSFEKSYIEKATLILGKILFENYQKMDDQGDKQKAAQGYISLYENEKYPEKVKAKSAFNASISFLDQGKTQESMEWLIRSLKHYKEQEAFLLTSQMLAISERYALLQDFSSASNLSKDLLQRFCQKKFKEKNQLYQNAVHYSLVEDQISNAYKNYKMATQCHIPASISQKAGEGIMDFLYFHRDVKNLIGFYSQEKANALYTELFFSYLHNMYWDALQKEEPSFQERISQYFKKAIKEGSLPKKLGPQVQAIHQYEGFSKKFNELKLNQFESKDTFDEALFNSQLEAKMQKLSQFKGEGELLLKTKHPEVVLGTYDLLFQAYHDFSQTIISYTPQGVPPEFVQGFQKVMGQIGHTLEKEATKFHRAGQLAIRNSELMSAYNKLFLPQRFAGIKKSMRYPAGHFALPIDQKGVRP